MSREFSNLCKSCEFPNCVNGQGIDRACEKASIFNKGYQQGRADAIEDFIKEHTSLNFRGEPYIFITNTEYEQLKEQTE